VRWPIGWGRHNVLLLTIGAARYTIPPLTTVFALLIVNPAS